MSIVRRIKWKANRLWSKLFPSKPRAFVGIRDQEPVTTAEWRHAGTIIDWIQRVIAGRRHYLESRNLDFELHYPQAIWQLDNGSGLYDGFRALCSKNRHVLNYFRMWTQQFTGYRLIDMGFAEGKRFPKIDDVNPSLDDRYDAIAESPDVFTERYRQVTSSLPVDLHISPPARLGEVGWNIDGKIVSYDTYVYLERLALMYEYGVIDHLKAVAKSGQTPRVIEIGGGFGALAYYLRQIVPETRFVIVDLPESLVFAGVYLSLMKPETGHVFMDDATPGDRLVPNSSGVTFVPNFMFDRIVEAGSEFDLAVNTLSMSEMSRDQVTYYCSGIKTMLKPDGAFFEQNQDNSALGKLDARNVIVEQFPHQVSLDSAIIPGLTQGRAHLWSKRPWLKGAAARPQRKVA